MPDDPDAALIERMVSEVFDVPLADAKPCSDESDMVWEREAMSRVLAVVREHEGQALAAAQKRIADLAATPDLRAAAILFRCPEGFEAMAAALGIADDTEARDKLDAAFKTVARNAKEQPDDNA